MDFYSDAVRNSKYIKIKKVNYLGGKNETEENGKRHIGL